MLIQFSELCTPIIKQLRKNVLKHFLVLLLLSDSLVFFFTFVHELRNDLKEDKCSGVSI